MDRSRNDRKVPGSVQNTGSLFAASAKRGSQKIGNPI